jgi:hypothetical protein
VSKWGPFSLIFYRGNRGKQDVCHVILRNKFSVEKGSMSWCFVMMQQAVLLSPKFGAKSWPVFMQSPQNVTAVCGIDCLDFENECFFVNNPFDVKENYEHALDFVLHLSHPFSL